MTGKNVYIAGPMRGIHEFNFPRFFEAAEYLKDIKGEYVVGLVFNPAEVDEAKGFQWEGTTGYETEGFDLRQALGGDLDWITGYADAVLLLPGWEQSRGARAELATAQALDLEAAEYVPGTDLPPNWRKATEFQPRPIAPPVTSPGTHKHPSVDDAFGCDVCQRSTVPTSQIREDVLAGWDLPADATVDANGVVHTKHPDRVTPKKPQPVGSPRSVEVAGKWPPDIYRDALKDLKARVLASVDARQNGEVRVVDPVTGGEKGSKPERFDLIPVGALREVARVYGFGAGKYADNNWRKGYAWHLSYAALQRHVTSFWDGEDKDPESGLPHLAHTAWQALTLLQFQLDNLGTDDRFKR